MTGPRPGAARGRPVDAGPAETAVAAAVRRHLWISLAVLLVVGVPTALGLSALAHDRAVADAVARSDRLASTVVVPLLSGVADRADVEPRSAPGTTVLDAIIEARVLDGTLHGVRVRDRSGGLVYTAGQLGPTPELVGLPSTPAAPGRAVGRDDERLHVLVEVPQQAGRAFLVEVVLPYSEVVRIEDALRWPTLAAGMLGLLGLTAAQLPLAVSLARQVQSAEKARRDLLSHSVAATDRERRRLARQLHDDVIQDLAGAGYTLESMQGQVEVDRTAVATVHRVVQADVEKLRAILFDVYPYQVAGHDLRQKLDALAEPLRRSGVDVVVEVDDVTAVGCDGARATLLHRVVRELLVNVSTHAAATTVVVVVHTVAGSLLLQVRDDGAGFDPSTAQQPGHVGLALVRDLVGDVGGELVVRSAPGEGTSVDVSLPLPPA